MMKKSIYKILFIVAFIVFLILVIPLVLFTPTHVDSEMSVDAETSVHEPRVAGLFIEFKDGTTEPEAKAILENCNMTINYSIDYNSDIMSKRYYIIVDKDKRMGVENELSKGENWTDSIFPDFEKGNYYIITVTEQAIHDKNFLAILKKNNLQVKNPALCNILFRDGSKNWIWGIDAVRIKNELEMNEKVLMVDLNYIEG